MTDHTSEIDFYELLSFLSVWYYYIVGSFRLGIIQVQLTEFKTLPPLFMESPTAVHELTIASIVLHL